MTMTLPPNSLPVTQIEKARGHVVVEEPGRRIIAEETASGGSALPWGDLAMFLRRVIDMALADYVVAVEHKGWVFFDRGLVDISGYLLMFQFWKANE
ncbi:AAA family ATPase [Chelatococcus asaccharovorans]|uniref:AAA family ATPase n=1 Tax=Chelatococcus asaccharovorans TaxID=28210 RepID=UPI00224C6B19|nr:AAA family ATPase [Chelatococcus asaccharovorans]CAH1652978.1 hypothetical protein CHELA40_10729 [Chelatococcus asaccharovorans]CAH1686181.1 hypothetical protein CHELA17_64878 [Chelatococcus asaccharovorans]